MSQNLTERFNKVVKEISSKAKKPNVRVFHERKSDGSYAGKTRCVIAYLDKGGPRSIVGMSVASISEPRPITKSDGYRIATERAYKKFLSKIKK